MEINQSPLVSIIMPTYNRADYILDTIRSIQSQTYTNWELLIIDDGSEDETATLVASLNDQRIRLFEMGRISVSGTLKNFGIKEAIGELIAFMDSDDLWHSKKLELQIQALSDCPNAAYSLTGGYNFKRPGIATEYFYKETAGSRCGQLFLSFCKGEVAAFIQSLIVRRELISKAGFFKENIYNSDFGFIGGLAYHFDGVIVYDHLLFRRIHDTNQNNEAWKISVCYHYDLIKRYRDDNWLPAATARHELFKSRIFLGKKLLDRNLRWQAGIAFLKAWRYKPFSIIPLKKIAKALLTRF